MNSKLGRHKKGRGPKGKRVISKVPTQKAENLSFLPAITVDGYMTCIVFRGAINAEIFEEFIKHDVIPHCNPYPGPKSVWIMLEYTSQRYQKCVNCDADAIFRISKPWSKKKAANSNFSRLTRQISTQSSILSLLLSVHYMEKKKHRLKGTETLQEVANKVLMVAKEAVTPEIARNQFRHCMILIDSGRLQLNEVINLLSTWESSF